MARQIRSELLRQKLLRLIDGHWDRLQYVIFHLNNLVEADAVADWLLRRGLRGENLVEWLDKNFDGMFLPMFDHVRADVNRSFGGRAVLVGRDYHGHGQGS